MVIDVPFEFVDPDGAFTLSWADSMGSFTTSFSRPILPLGGFGGPEKDRDVCVVWVAGFTAASTYLLSVPGWSSWLPDFSQCAVFAGT